MPPAGEIALLIIAILLFVGIIGWLGYKQVGTFVDTLVAYRRGKSERHRRSTEVTVSA